jgi:ferredoxin-NADP reductase
VVSLQLVDAGGQPLPAYRPGQFLTFKIPTAGGRSVPRNYSLSGDPADGAHYRISVKREAAPAGRPDLTDGAGSSFIHDDAVEGAILHALMPRGDFVLAEGSHRPVLLLAGGIGITPLAAMAHVLARQRKRPTYLIHACDSAALLPLGKEMRDLAARSPNLHHAVCFRHRTPGDENAAQQVFGGLVSAEILRVLVPIGDYEAYICGPPPFMQAMYDMLAELGVAEARIFYEFFGEARKLAVSRPPTEPAPAVVAPIAAPESQPRVTFKRLGRTVDWDPAFKSLLDFAEAQGLAPAFSCRAGICQTCSCACAGNIRYVEDPLEVPSAGYALICCSIPDGHVELDL